MSTNFSIRFWDYLQKFESHDFFFSLKKIFNCKVSKLCYKLINISLKYYNIRLPTVKTLCKNTLLEWLHILILKKKKKKLFISRRTAISTSAPICTVALRSNGNFALWHRWQSSTWNLLDSRRFGSSSRDIGQRDYNREAGDRWPLSVSRSCTWFSRVDWLGWSLH